MNTRQPLSLTRPSERRYLFRRSADGGLELNLPFSESVPNQCARLSSDGLGVELNVGGTVIDDPFLKVNDDGSVSIRTPDNP